MGSCVTRVSLNASIADVVAHADDTVVKLLVIQCLRTYAVSTATDLDDALVDMVERRLLGQSPIED